MKRVMPYTPIVATLGYVLSPDRREVLLINRNTRITIATPTTVLILN